MIYLIIEMGVSSNVLNIRPAFETMIYMESKLYTSEID